MTQIKICGITNLPDALAAVEAGADMLGFNFYLKSPRYIEKNICAEISSVLKKEFPQIKLIGVFVNALADEVKNILDACSLDFAQLHGDETFEMLNELNEKAFKAFRGKMDEKLIVKNEPAFLLDAQVKDMYGGSGVKADWNVASELAKQYKFLLAGGLNSENVAASIAQVKPWGVDAASGVESAAGKKDAQKMREFVRAVRSVPVISEQ
ncbi:MAG: phosphoribosylanthranilate isomerase [Anaerolineales bacterium]|nr:phosphoribosylanthranilate isomerase [Anaerolineales bacterium]